MDHIQFIYTLLISIIKSIMLLESELLPLWERSVADARFERSDWWITPDGAKNEPLIEYFVEHTNNVSEEVIPYLTDEQFDVYVATRGVVKDQSPRHDIFKGNTAAVRLWMRELPYITGGLDRLDFYEIDRCLFQYHFGMFILIVDYWQMTLEEYVRINPLQFYVVNDPVIAEWFIKRLPLDSVYRDRELAQYYLRSRNNLDIDLEQFQTLYMSEVEPRFIFRHVHPDERHREIVLNNDETHRGRRNRLQNEMLEYLDNYA